MAKYSRIEWTDATWSPVTGCAPISEGCQNCYAKRMANRLRGRCGYPADDPFRVTLHPERLGEPLRWKEPRRVFVCSMGDLFHEDVKDEWIARIWWVMGQCAGYLDPSRYRGHTFIILTKRPERMQKWLNGWSDGETRRQWIESFGAVYDWMSGPKYWPDVLPNVWLGVTAENQRRADERIPILLEIPAAVRFVSVEPMLGPVDLTKINQGSDSWINALTGDWIGYHHYGGAKTVKESWPKLDWCIVGGETGPGARPMRLNWVRSLRDQCQTAGISFFFKAWGEYGPNWLNDDNGKIEGSEWMDRMGKKKAGRILDGRTWDEMPEI